MSLQSAPLLTVKETAEYLRIPVPTVYYLVQRGQLPAVQIGGRWRVNKDLIDKDVLKMSSSKEAPPAAVTKITGNRILLVDDQHDILELLVMALTHSGYHPDTADTGQGALDFITKKSYDILFLDLNLPDMIGEDVFEKALEIQPELHVVVMTGVATVRNLEKILSLGPVTVLQKPFKMDQLLHITKTLMGAKTK